MSPPGYSIPKSRYLPFPETGRVVLPIILHTVSSLTGNPHGTQQQYRVAGSVSILQITLSQSDEPRMFIRPFGNDDRIEFFGSIQCCFVRFQLSTPVAIGEPDFRKAVDIDRLQLHGTFFIVENGRNLLVSGTVDSTPTRQFSTYRIVSRSFP